MQKLLSLLFIAISAITYSQTVTLKGKVTDPDNLPLEAATVYLSSVNDSTLIDYTITTKNGSWELKTRARQTPVYLKVSFVGLAGHRQLLEKIDADADYGTIKMEDRGTDLKEVVIQGEVPPIRIKKDTLEFDAASFAVRPDANVQELLKQLPGVDIDADGKITVNGKEVSQILVNGKPFFDKDGKVALQNLPAEIINKIQITDKKDKEEELTGQKAKGNEASINITIDEEKNKGIFGRIMGGFGSDGRYEHSGLVNYFKGERKISALASTNNINSTGFSMDEIFDNMSGGRNVNMWSDGSSFSINGMQFGGGKGITRSDIIGLNYADKWVKGFDGGLNYFYTAADSRNNNRTREINYLPSGQAGADPGSTVAEGYIRQSESRNRQDRYAHNYNTQFNIAIDSTTSIYLEPKFVKGHSQSDDTVSQRSESLTQNRVLNDNQGVYGNVNDNFSFKNMAVFSKKFNNKKGRTLSLYLENENTKDDGEELNNTLTNTYDYTTGTVQTVSDRRNQRRYNNRTNDSYTITAQFYEPVGDSSQVSFAFAYRRLSDSENRRGFDFDDATETYTNYNAGLSGYLQSVTDRYRPVVGYFKSNSKMWFNVQAGPRIIDYRASGNYMGNFSTVKRNYTVPSADVQLSYNMSKTKSIWTSYSYDLDMPQTNQLLEIDDVINPLSVTRGYTELAPRRYHDLYFSFRDYDYTTRTGYNFYLGGSYNEKAIVNYISVDENARSYVSYRNVNDTYNTYFGFNWNKSFKNEAHDFKVNLGFYGNYSRDKGFMNEQLFDSKGLTLGPRINLTYKYGELLTINPNYSFSYNQTNYSNYAIDKASNFLHRVGLSTTSYWPKHITFGNDVSYNYNSQLSSEFKKDFLLWNTSIGYSFWGDKLTFKTKVYDLLNQNQATSRTITATTIRDEQNVVLRRYVMFSLSLKLEKFAGKKSDQRAQGSIITF